MSGRNSFNLRRDQGSRASFTTTTHSALIFKAESVFFFPPLFLYFCPFDGKVKHLCRHYTHVIWRQTKVLLNLAFSECVVMSSNIKEPLIPVPDLPISNEQICPCCFLSTNASTFKVKASCLISLPGYFSFLFYRLHSCPHI